MNAGSREMDVEAVKSKPVFAFFGVGAGIETAIYEAISYRVDGADSGRFVPRFRMSVEFR